MHFNGHCTVGQKIHVRVPGNCGVYGQRKGARNFHRMMRECQRRYYLVRDTVSR
jgi:hypothetical protein